MDLCAYLPGGGLQWVQLAQAFKLKLYVDQTDNFEIKVAYMFFRQ